MVKTAHETQKKKPSTFTEKFKKFKNPQVKINIKTGMLVWALHWYLTSKVTGRGQSTANHWQSCEEAQGLSAIAHAFLGGVSYLHWTMVCGHENNPETIKNAVQTNPNHSPPVKDGRIERNGRTHDPKTHEISQRTEGRGKTSLFWRWRIIGFYSCLSIQQLKWPSLPCSTMVYDTDLFSQA